MNETSTRPAETPQPDEMPIAGEAAAAEPANWDRHQMETDDGGEPRERDEADLSPAWNEGEMAEERNDHTRSPLTPTNELDQPSGGLSGHGSNPGGG
ncbi:MAG TPA: hypothetical protein VNF73_00990, partial [Candidatus Saccharimonadales bacterium]|nr:hypothetical protein [Candidatus Saccharimonadales bacterium]